MNKLSCKNCKITNIRLFSENWFSKSGLKMCILMYRLWLWTMRSGVKGVFSSLSCEDTILAPLWDPHSWHWDNTRLLKIHIEKTTTRDWYLNKNQSLKNSLEREKTGKFENSKKSSSNATSAKLLTLIFLWTTFQFFSKIAALQSNKSGRIW